MTLDDAACFAHVLPEVLDRSRRSRFCRLHEIRVLAGSEELVTISGDLQPLETKILQFSVDVSGQMCSICNMRRLSCCLCPCLDPKLITSSRRVDVILVLMRIYLCF